MSQQVRATLPLNSHDVREKTFTAPLIIEYVADAHGPYVWIGDERGRCFATVDAHDLIAFLTGEHNQESRSDDA